MKSMEFKALTAQWKQKFIMTQTQGYAPKDIWGLE
jgi:hypothetical protein